MALQGAFQFLFMSSFIEAEAEANVKDESLQDGVIITVIQQSLSMIS